jgi:fibronectin-binding autotransporter adhesin
VYESRFAVTASIAALILGFAGPALAAGGAGGAACSGATPGGAGGTGFTGNAGGAGSLCFGNEGQIAGSGGGGGAAGGGAGGGGGGVFGGAGGNGGVNGNGAGAALITNTSALAGVAGANGGNGSGGFPQSGGGGGGAGGYGAIVTGSGINSNTSNIAGGAGGAGGTGQGGGTGGSGGDGGVGMQFTASGATLTNFGAITGGNGGAGGIGGFASGANGAGGAGIVGSGLTVVNGGTITGGLAGNGVTRANAITFTGGVNSLTLLSGYSITGNVVAASTADSLILGGSVNSSFAVSSIGAGQQYRNFGLFQKTGSSLWTLTGTTTALTPWSILGGTLNVSSDGALGAASGGLTLNGGALQYGAGFSSTRAVMLGAVGGTIDTNSFNGLLSGTLSGPGGLTKTGAGTLTLSGNNSFTGLTTINGGTLALGAGGSLFSSSGVNLAAAGAGFDISAAGNQQIQDLAGVSGSNLVLGSNTLTAGTVNSTSFAGVISGAGSFTKVGSGTLTLTGASTYGGGTMLAGGTLAVGNNSALGSGMLALGGGTVLQSAAAGLSLGNAITLPGAGTIDTQTNALTLSGAVSGAGSFTKIGSGTLTLTGANTYTGGTTLAGGTLAVGSNTALGSGGLALGGGTVLQSAAAGLSLGNAITLGGAGTIDTQSNTLTLSGAVSGAGSFTKTGAGTLILTGANTYSGGTMLAGGTLALGSSTALGSGGLALGGGTVLQSAADGISLGNAITLGGAGTIDTQANALTLTGVISGAGSFAKIGSGTLTLPGPNSYTGGTTIAAGIVAISNNSALGSGTLTLTGGTLQSGAASLNLAIPLAFGAGGGTIDTQANALTLGGMIAGSGAFTKIGSGTLILTGNGSAYTGTATLAAGTLTVGPDAAPNASLGGTLIVQSGATLTGNGSVGSLLNAGTVVPGGSIGVLSVNGNFSQGPGGTLRIEVSPTAASQLRVAGTAALGGTLALLFDPGVYNTQSYKLVTASSVSGTFATVTGVNPSGVPQVVLINPADVTLQLGGPATLNSTPGTIIIAPFNATIYTAVTSTLVIDGQQTNSILFDRLAGLADGLTTAGGAAPLRLAQGNIGALSDVAAALPGALGSQGAWFRAIGGFAMLNGSSTAPGFTGAAAGFLAGYDRAVAPNLWLGLAAGYLHSDISERSTSSGTVESGRVALYGAGLVGPSRLMATLGYAYDRTDTARGLTGVGTARQGHNGNEFTLAGQWSLPLAVPGIGGADASLTPRAGLQFLHLGEGGFSESGAGGFNLSSGGRDTDSLQPYIGVTLAQSFVTDGGIRITPEARLGYARELLSNARLITETTVSGANFFVAGVRPTRDIVTVGVGVTVEAMRDMRLYAAYDAILRTGNTAAHNFSAGARIRF